MKGIHVLKNVFPLKDLQDILDVIYTDLKAIILNVAFSTKILNNLNFSLRIFKLSKKKEEICSLFPA